MDEIHIEPLTKPLPLQQEGPLGNMPIFFKFYPYPTTQKSKKGGENNPHFHNYVPNDA